MIRIRGKTDEPLDDVVLEVKEVRDITGIDCITISQKSDPFRVLIGQARIAYQPYDFLGYIRFQEDMFWIHSWVDNYKELKHNESFESLDDLAEVVFDVGVQLGQGHPKQIAAPLDVQLRREQLLLLSKTESELKMVCKELAAETIAAWEAFCEKEAAAVKK